MKSHFALVFAALACAPAWSHVSLKEPQAAAGSDFEAVFRIGHGCDGSPTSAVTVRIPPGVSATGAHPVAGWTITAAPGAVTWTAGAGAALPSKQAGEFVLVTQLPNKPGPAWFKVTQTCEQGKLEWAEVPASGTATTGLKSPAALLEVLSPRDFAQLRLLPKVEAAWARSTVPGQQSSGAFMKLTARDGTQLVGVSTPVAGVAEVHEMKMEGQVMKMRALDKLDLPAGRTVELKPGGYHLMLLDLKQPLQKDTTIPLTLILRNAQGTESRLDVKLPVVAQPPGSTDHKH